MRKEYTFLFNSLTYLLQEVQKLEQAIIAAQQQAEELYIEGED